MKIAIITSGILPVPAVQGGAVENLIDYVLEYNDQQKLHDITVFSVYHKKVRQHNALQSQLNHYEYVDTKSIFFRIGAKLHSYLGRQYYYHYQLEFYFKRVWHKMKRLHFDLIILENRPGFALQLSEYTKTPIISHIHTNLLYEPSSVNKKIISATKRFLAVSNYIKTEIEKVDVDTDIRVVYNGLDTTKFHLHPIMSIRRNDLGITDSDFVAVFWGRLVPEKGIKELIMAINLLKQYPDIRLLVIGAINYEDTDKQTNPFIEELKILSGAIKGKIVFTGFVPYENIPNYIAIGNVAVIPSCINEALGMTCIEASAMGLPVIATNDGGISEALAKQKHILIEKDNNLPTHLASAILEVKEHYKSYQGNSLDSLFSKESYVRCFFKNISL